MEIPLVPLSIPERLASVASALRVQTKQMRGARGVSAHLAASPAWFQRTQARVQVSSQADLHALWQHEIRPHVKQGVWCVLGIAKDSADYTMKLRRRAGRPRRRRLLPDHGRATRPPTG